MPEPKSSKPKSAKSRDTRSYSDFQWLCVIFWGAVTWIGRLRTLYWLGMMARKYLPKISGLVERSLQQPLYRDLDVGPLNYSPNIIIYPDANTPILAPKLQRICYEFAIHEALIHSYFNSLKYHPMELIGWVDAKGAFRV